MSPRTPIVETRSDSEFYYAIPYPRFSTHLKKVKNTQNYDVHAKPLLKKLNFWNLANLATLERGSQCLQANTNLYEINAL